MAVGDSIDRDYLNFTIDTFFQDNYDFSNDVDEYFYIHANAFNFKFYEVYALFSNRDSRIYVDAWDYATNAWVQVVYSVSVAESKSAGVGANCPAPSADYQYAVNYTTDLWRITHHPENNAVGDCWFNIYGGGNTLLSYNDYLKGHLLRMRGSTYKYGWTTNSTLTPLNTTWMNTTIQRGVSLTDSLKTRILVH